MSSYLVVDFTGWKRFSFYSVQNAPRQYYEGTLELLVGSDRYIAYGCFNQHILQVGIGGKTGKRKKA